MLSLYPSRYAHKKDLKIPAGTLQDLVTIWVFPSEKLILPERGCPLHNSAASKPYTSMKPLLLPLQDSNIQVCEKTLMSILQIQQHKWNHKSPLTRRHDHYGAEIPSDAAGKALTDPQGSWDEKDATQVLEYKVYKHAACSPASGIPAETHGAITCPRPDLLTPEQSQVWEGKSNKQGKSKR